MEETPTTTIEAPASSYAISLDKVTKTFGDQNAVEDLTFELPQGEIIGLIGPSGCGKTTTVRLMTGIYNPSAGAITVLGTDPLVFTQVEREKIGYMMQHFVLYPDLSIQENMNFAAAIYGHGPFRRAKRITDLLEFVELTEHKNKLAKNISGGMQRRLALAATLIHDPDLIFLDEPTAGIDPILRRKFWDHFIELREQGKTLIVTTQYVNEAAYCDLVGVMADGKLLFLQTPENLMKAAYGGEVLDLRTKPRLSAGMIAELEDQPYARSNSEFLEDGTLRIIVDEASTALPQVMEWVNGHNLELETAEQFFPPYDDVFVKLIEDYRANYETGDQVTTAGSQA